MKNDQFINGQVSIGPTGEEDGFRASHFPSLQVVAKKTEFKKVNRLFQSQTAFMPMEEELDPRDQQILEVSVQEFLPRALTA